MQSSSLKIRDVNLFQRSKRSARSAADQNSFDDTPTKMPEVPVIENSNILLSANSDLSISFPAKLRSQRDPSRTPASGQTSLPHPISSYTGTCIAFYGSAFGCGRELAPWSLEKISSTLQGLLFRSLDRVTRWGIASWRGAVLRSAHLRRAGRLLRARVEGPRRGGLRAHVVAWRCRTALSRRSSEGRRASGLAVALCRSPRSLSPSLRPSARRSSVPPCLSSSLPPLPDCQNTAISIT